MVSMRRSVRRHTVRHTWAWPEAVVPPGSMKARNGGSVAWMVPVPGGFGAYHFMVALALSSVYGLGWDTGMLYATINHEAQAVMMVIMGFISYIYEVTKK